MATSAGVWIDHQQAIVVLLTDAGRNIKKIPFDLGQIARPSGGSRPNNKFTPNDFIAEDKRERKIENDRKDYYKDVIAALLGADSLLILGPGEAKGELLKRVKSRRIPGLTVELETADKMTDCQLAAKVEKHFAKAPARKSVAPKKKAKAAPGKRRQKKSGKKKPGK